MFHWFIFLLSIFHTFLFYTNVCTCVPFIVFPLMPVGLCPCFILLQIWLSSCHLSTFPIPPFHSSTFHFDTIHLCVYRVSFIHFHFWCFSHFSKSLVTLKMRNDKWKVKNEMIRSVNQRWPKGVPASAGRGAACRRTQAETVRCTKEIKSLFPLPAARAGLS